METNLIRRTIKLRAGTQKALWEAMRRLLWVGEQPRTLNDFLGLGSQTNYTSAIEDGMMEYAGRKLKGYICWFKLTDLGKIIVATVLSQGIAPRSCDDTVSRFPQYVEIEHEV